MTVYLKGLDGRLDQIERNVERLTIDSKYISIDYKEPYKWGIVSGVAYYTNEMEVKAVEA